MPLTFRRIGTAFHPVIADFDDLVALLEVPDAHWIATSAPTAGLHCDPQFLRVLDEEGDGRVRAEELRAAIRWVEARLSDPARWQPGSEVLALAALAPGAADLHAAAQLALAAAGATGAAEVSLGQVRDAHRTLLAKPANGDGIVPPAAAPTAAISRVIADVLEHLPGATDAAGVRGVDHATLDAFEAARAEALAWAEAEVEACAWGPDSVAWAEATRSVAARVDAFFAACRLVAAEPAAAGRVAARSEGVDLAGATAQEIQAVIDAMPVAEPSAERVLRWADLRPASDLGALHAFRRSTVEGVLGPAAAAALPEADWGRLAGEGAAILAWADQRPRHAVLRLGAARLRELDAEALAPIRALCEADAAVAAPLAALADLERAILYQRWLVELANNLAAMPRLYERDRAALFEQGTLVLAGQELKLALLVTDAAAHRAVAGHASLYLVYARIAGNGREFDVVAPLTSGTSTGIFVGKRGVFVAAGGGSYDAVVTHIHPNPVSILEAVVQPFVRVGVMVGERIDRWQSAADAEHRATLGAGPDTAAAGAIEAARVASPAAAAAPVAAPPAKKALEPAAVAGLAAAAGLAMAAVGSSLALLASAFEGKSFLGALVTATAMIAAVLAPFAVVAWWKLRLRNFGGLLEASGWAVNDPLFLSSHLARAFTRRPPRPPGSRLDWVDGAAGPEFLADLGLEDRAPGWRARRAAAAIAIVAIALLLGALLGPWRDLLLDAVQRPPPPPVPAAAPTPGVPPVTAPFGR